MVSSEIELPADYAELLEAMKTRIAGARLRAQQTVNTSVIELYRSLARTLSPVRRDKAGGQESSGGWPPMDIKGVSNQDLQYVPRETMLLADVLDDAPLVASGGFGPTAGVVTFSPEDEAVWKANATEVSLAAGVWSSSPKRGWGVPERLEAGIVGVNEPLPSVAFAPMCGGKQSSLGQEGAGPGLEEFEEVQYVAWRNSRRSSTWPGGGRC